MRKALLTLLLLTVLATPATAAQIDVQASIADEPVDGVEATISQVSMRGGMNPVANATIEAGEVSFSDLETGMYSVSFEADGTEYRDGAVLQENGSSETLEFSVGDPAAGSVETSEGPVEGAQITLSDVFGEISNFSTDANGSFETPALMEGTNYTVEVDYRGYTFSERVQSGDTEISIRVSEPVTDPSVLEFAPSQVSQLHSDRMAIVDFNTTPTRVTDFSSLRNPTDSPFRGSVEIELPKGANMRGVTDISGRPLNYSWRNSSAFVKLSLEANSSKAVGARYTVPGTSFELQPGRDLDSVLMMFVTPEGVSRESFTPTGPVALQQTNQPLNGVRYVGQARNVSAGTSIGVQYSAPDKAVPGVSGSGGTRSSLLFGGVAAAVVIAGLFLYQNREEMDIPSLGALSGEEGGGEDSSAGYCSSCGAQVTVDDNYCPSCGEDLT